MLTLFYRVVLVLPVLVLCLGVYNLFSFAIRFLLEILFVKTIWGNSQNSKAEFKVGICVTNLVSQWRINRACSYNNALLV